MKRGSHLRLKRRPAKARVGRAALLNSDAEAPAVPGDPDERRWQQLQRELKYWWNELTDEDVLKVAGRRDQLLMILNEKYGYGSRRASRELNAALRARPRKR